MNFYKDNPFNRVDNPEKELEVTVSVTLSKTLKIKVSDYEITDFGKDEDGNYFETIDYSNCNLRAAVEEQFILPQEAHQCVASYAFGGGFKECPEADMLRGWNVDDFETVLE